MFVVAVVVVVCKNVTVQNPHTYTYVEVVLALLRCPRRLKMRRIKKKNTLSPRQYVVNITDDGRDEVEN